MIKITAVLTQGVEKNMGSVNGLINSLILSNPQSSSAIITVKTSNTIIWNVDLPAHSSIRVPLDIIVDENIYCSSTNDNTNVIINIIETV